MNKLYESLKILMAASEDLGEIKTAELYQRTSYRRAGAEVTGTTDSGATFILRIEEGEEEC